ncbi:helix-turn-helix domain-containing protein [Listeria monocytogenes]|uniref:helix-turn-helix domain-containing protein n=1 Tax=Listeria monocytogenes TaxID=1639 RepID=UPI0010B3525E|nr:helix-turn-helix domain-containing protein [Listeria monocytogenes]EAC9872078.1 helix-turn-helix domain-containing protein [Listeria monocytogenes]EAE6568647.1 helix-turn-helix domain-containing protein [Listeria monocytogenes]
MSKGKYIHFDTLVSAKTGDIVAIQDILNQFRGYIISRSLRTAHSTNILTPIVQHKMETDLIEAIYKFEIR